MKRVCVFTGSRVGNDPVYAEAAVALAAALCSRGLGLVYGAGSTGLMGVLASEMLARGGHVVGVIPHGLVRAERAHEGLSELVLVPGMHERKAQMAARADAFIALPGGFGTLEELMEIVTWAQLGLHGKPIGLLDVASYFGPLLTFFERMVAHGFAAPGQRDALVVRADAEALVAALVGSAR